MKVRTAETMNIETTLMYLVFSASANPTNDDNGTAKNEMVKILPPSAIPKILTAHAGKVEKCPPSTKKARHINSE